MYDETEVTTMNFNPQGPRRPRRGAVFIVVLKQIFQSPGPSQAPTLRTLEIDHPYLFQSPGPSQAPTLTITLVAVKYFISIPRALAGPDADHRLCRGVHGEISIPRALAGPDPEVSALAYTYTLFQSPGPSQAPTSAAFEIYQNWDISIPRALAGPDTVPDADPSTPGISIPRALAGPDMVAFSDFSIFYIFQSPGPSQAPTERRFERGRKGRISIPRALAGPDHA